MSRRDQWKHNRLRKYRRKKFKRSDPLALKYWSYWFRIYHCHENLWTDESVGAEFMKNP